MIEPVNLYIAASGAKTEVGDLLQATRASAISFEALRRENTELKERNIMLEQSLLQEVNEHKVALTRSGDHDKDLETAHQELQALLGLTQQLKDEIHRVLGLNILPDLQTQQNVALQDTEDNTIEQRDALQVPETEANS